MLTSGHPAGTKKWKSEEIEGIFTNLETLGENVKAIKRRLEDAERRFETIR